MNASRVIGWTAAFLGLILIGNLHLHNKQKDVQAVLSIEQIEEIWVKTSPEFRDAVFRDSLATAGIGFKNDAVVLSSPQLDNNCRGGVVVQNAIESRGSIPGGDVRAIVRASACYTLTGRWG